MIKKNGIYLHKNLLLLFVVGIVFVGLVGAYKFFLSKPSYIYVKVKVGQGLWWANTMKPNTWLVEGIKQAKEEIDITGQSLAQILGVRYYRWWGGGQYDVYVMAKLRVTKLGKTNKYNFKRVSVGVGAPIDFEFPNVQFSGTIMQISEKPIIEKYIEKTVYITKKGAYPWEYDTIPIGDQYFDGERVIFQVLSKETRDTNNISTDYYGNSDPDTTEPKKYITLKVMMQVREENGQLLFGDEQLVIQGQGIFVATSKYAYNDFTVAKVE